MPRRFPYFVICCLVVALGLATRRYATVLPVFLAKYGGDTLWAAMVFFLIKLLAPKCSPFRAAIVTLMVSYSVEISQFYRAPWINAIRRTRLGGLVLGYGFLWSDIVCYTAGVTLSLGLEKFREWRQETSARLF